MTNALSVFQRLCLAVIGGYAFTVGVSALLARALARVMPGGEAVLLMAMLAFVIYLVVLIAAFAEPQLKRLWLWLGGGAAAAYGLAAWQTSLSFGF